MSLSLVYLQSLSLVYLQSMAYCLSTHYYSLFHFIFAFIESQEHTTPWVFLHNTMPGMSRKKLTWWLVSMGYATVQRLPPVQTQWPHNIDLHVNHKSSTPEMVFSEMDLLSNHIKSHKVLLNGHYLNLNLGILDLGILTSKLAILAILTSKLKSWQLNKNLTNHQPCPCPCPPNLNLNAEWDQIHSI